MTARRRHWRTLEALASLLLDTRRLEEALPLLTELAERHRAAGELDAAARALLSLAGAQRVLGHHDAAVPVYRELLDLHDLAQIDDRDALARAGYGMAVSSMAIGDPTTAEACLRDCVPLYSSDNWRRALMSSMLGESIGAQKRFAEAEEVLLTAQDALVASAAPAGQIAAGASRLVQFYEAWHAVDPDAGADASAATWRETLEHLNSGA